MIVWFFYSLDSEENYWNSENDIFLGHSIEFTFFLIRGSIWNVDESITLIFYLMINTFTNMFFSLSYIIEV